MITLEKISHTNLHAILALEVAAEQKPFYPRSNAYSIAEGLFPPDEDPVWMAAICHTGTPVGFMMTSEAAEVGEYFLWRMMIDRHYQGKGYGSAAMQLLFKRISAHPTNNANKNSRVLLLSHMKANGAAGQFYTRLGFTYTGEAYSDGDLEMKKVVTGVD